MSCSFSRCLSRTHGYKRREIILTKFNIITDNTRTAMVGKHTAELCPPIAHQDSNGGQAHHRTLPTNCTPGQQWWANTPQDFAHQLHTRTAMVGKHTTGLFPHIAHQDSNGGQTEPALLLYLITEKLSTITRN